VEFRLPEVAPLLLLRADNGVPALDGAGQSTAVGSGGGGFLHSFSPASDALTVWRWAQAAITSTCGRTSVLFSRTGNRSPPQFDG